VLTFGAQVKAGTGNFVLTPTGGGDTLTIAAGDAQVTYSTSAPWTATINPTAVLAKSKQYTITTSADGVITDNADALILFAQITGTNYQFTTGTKFGSPTYLPAHSATGINIDANIVLTFGAQVKAGTGNFVLTPTGGGDTLTIAAGDAQVTYSTSAPWTATINPTAVWTKSKQYTITMASGVIKDNTDDTIHFAGISGTDYQFTTGTTFGVVTTYLPANAATGINIDANIVLTFAARVKAGTGNIVLTPAGGTAINIAAGNAFYSPSAPWTATFNASSSLTNNKLYTITMASGVITDHADALIHFAGISGTNYQFTTAAAGGSAAGNSTGNSTTAASGAAASTSYTQVTQKLEFPSLTVATYTGNTKGNIECAYTNTVEKGAATTTPTWCTMTTTSPFRTYKTGISITSSVARRAAAVTFTLKVDTSVMTSATLKTTVAANSNAANFDAKLTAVNTGTGLNITSPGTPTVHTATFKSVGSGASNLLPSMLGLVSALYIAFKHM